MSLVNIKNRHTADPEEFDNNSSSDQSFLYLKNPEESLVESFSLELSLGSGWAERYSDKERQLMEIEAEGIKIGRKASVVVEVNEEISMPHNLYGIIVPTGSLFLSKGILIAPSKVEPSFNGKLKLRLFNTSNEVFVLKKKQKLASAIFFSTDVTEFHNRITKSSEIAKNNIGTFKRLSRWIGNNQSTFSAFVITPLLTLSVLAITYFSYYRPVLNNQKQQMQVSNTQSLSAQKEVESLKRKVEMFEKKLTEK